MLSLFGQTIDIRKFDEVCTMPAAARAAIVEALAFHRAIGVERKAARLRYLTTTPMLATVSPRLIDGTARM